MPLPTRMSFQTLAHSFQNLFMLSLHEPEICSSHKFVEWQQMTFLKSKKEGKDQESDTIKHHT